MVAQDQASLDAAALVAAQRYREEQQSRIPNFTDTDLTFDVAWAAGDIVATVAEQDASWSDPEGYRAEVRQRCAAHLPSAPIVDSGGKKENSHA